MNATLLIEDTIFRDEFLLTNSRTGPGPAITFSRCHFQKGFRATGTVIPQSLRFVECSFRPLDSPDQVDQIAVDFAHASIAGDLSLTDCRIEGRFFAQGLKTTGCVQLRALILEAPDLGQTAPSGQQIMRLGELTLGDLQKPVGNKASFSEAKKAKQVLFRLEAAAICLDEADIGASLEICAHQSGTPRNSRVDDVFGLAGEALGARCSVIAGDIFARDLKAEHVALFGLRCYGAMNFASSHIRGNCFLRCMAYELNCPVQCVVSLENEGVEATTLRLIPGNAPGPVENCTANFSLFGTHIEGVLDMTHAKISGNVDMLSIVVDSNVRLDSIYIGGTLEFFDAKIHGSLYMDQAFARVEVSLYRVNIDGNLQFWGLKTEGDLWLSYSKILGRALAQPHSLTVAEDPKARNLEVGKNLYLNGAEIGGFVVGGAKIEGRIEIRTGTFGRLEFTLGPKWDVIRDKAGVRLAEGLRLIGCEAGALEIRSVTVTDVLILAGLAITGRDQGADLSVLSSTIGRDLRFFQDDPEATFCESVRSPLGSVTWIHTPKPQDFSASAHTDLLLTATTVGGDLDLRNVQVERDIKLRFMSVGLDVDIDGIARNARISNLRGDVFHESKFARLYPLKCRHLDATSLVCKGNVRIKGAIVGGDLVLQANQIGGELDLRGTQVNGAIELNDAIIARDVRTGASEGSFAYYFETRCLHVDAEKVQCSGDLDLTGLRVLRKLGPFAQESVCASRGTFKAEGARIKGEVLFVPREKRDRRMTKETEISAQYYLLATMQAEALETWWDRRELGRSLRENGALGEDLDRLAQLRKRSKDLRRALGKTRKYLKQLSGNRPSEIHAQLVPFAQDRIEDLKLSRKKLERSISDLKKRLLEPELNPNEREELEKKVAASQAELTQRSKVIQSLDAHLKRVAKEGAQIDLPVSVEAFAANLKEFLDRPDRLPDPLRELWRLYKIDQREKEAADRAARATWIRHGVATSPDFDGEIMLRDCPEERTTDYLRIQLKLVHGKFTELPGYLRFQKWVMREKGIRKDLQDLKKRFETQAAAPVPAKPEERAGWLNERMDILSKLKVAWEKLDRLHSDFSPAVDAAIELVPSLAKESKVQSIISRLEIARTAANTQEVKWRNIPNYTAFFEEVLQKLERSRAENPIPPAALEESARSTASLPEVIEISLAADDELARLQAGLGVLAEVSHLFEKKDARYLSLKNGVNALATQDARIDSLDGALFRDRAVGAAWSGPAFVPGYALIDGHSFGGSGECLNLSGMEAAYLLLTDHNIPFEHARLSLERSTLGRLEIIEPPPKPINLSKTVVGRWKFGAADPPSEKEYIGVLENMEPFDQSTWISVEQSLRNEAREEIADRVYSAMRWKSIRQSIDSEPAVPPTDVEQRRKEEVIWPRCFVAVVVFLILNVEAIFQKYFWHEHTDKFALLLEHGYFVPKVIAWFVIVLGVYCIPALLIAIHYDKISKQSDPAEGLDTIDFLRRRLGGTEPKRIEADGKEEKETDPLGKLLFTGIGIGLLLATLFLGFQVIDTLNDRLAAIAHYNPPIATLTGPDALPADPTLRAPIMDLRWTSFLLFVESAGLALWLGRTYWRSCLKLLERRRLLNIFNRKAFWGVVFEFGTQVWRPIFLVTLPLFLLSVCIFSYPKYVRASNDTIHLLGWKLEHPNLADTEVSPTAITYDANRLINLDSLRPDQLEFNTKTPPQPVGVKPAFVPLLWMESTWSIWDAIEMTARYEVPVLGSATETAWEASGANICPTPLSAERYATLLAILNAIAWPLFLIGISANIFRGRKG